MRFEITLLSYDKKHVEHEEIFEGTSEEAMGRVRKIYEENPGKKVSIQYLIDETT